MIIILQLVLALKVLPDLECTICALCDEVFEKGIKSDSLDIMVMFDPLQLLALLQTPDNG